MTDQGPVQAADQETHITLGVLDAVADNASVTQRSVARDLGIALGLANSYLKRCVRKGLIKVQQAPANRYAYYLTPKGFAEKSRLSAEYLRSSFTFFRRARAQCEDALSEAQNRGWTDVVLMGAGEMTEIMALCAHDNSLALTVVSEKARSRPRIAGLSAVSRLADLKKTNIDGIIVTDLEQPQIVYEHAVAAVGVAKVLVLPLLRVRTNMKMPVLSELS